MSAPQFLMEAVSLDQGPRYVALSYKWDDTKSGEVKTWKGQKVVINGQRENQNKKPMVIY
jgi:hypothetical protein